MIRLRKYRKLKFEKAMEINGISPLPHYYEEIYTNQIGLPALGMRGDKNYLFYSKNGFGAGYYEEREKELAADSVYNFFKKPGNKEKYFRGAAGMIKKLQTKIKQIDNIDLSKLSVKELARLFLEVNELHGKTFSYFVVSQPYRMKRFEEFVASELKKRVAASRIDTYMTSLGTSNEPTVITYEELDWLDFVLKYKGKYPSAPQKAQALKKAHPDMYADLMKHFEKYKVLTLGDGNWEYNLEFFLHNLVSDYKKDTKTLTERRAAMKLHQIEAEEHRKKLIEDLYLDEKTVSILDFLAKMGHIRLAMRIEGWVPFVRTIIKVDIALSIALTQSTVAGGLLNFVEPKEIKKIIKTGKAVSDDVIIKRIGDEREFLIHNHHGKYLIYYGAEAELKFKELVAVIDHEATTELTGSTAVRGKVTGTACVYKWGDDMKVKQKVIQKHQILIAGQTRPAMMPMIRLAKGIVTDEGGVTSHAAIVSRELGIPSVIGTIHATQVFKDGDSVELDADNGIVRKLS